MSDECIVCKRVPVECPYERLLRCDCVVPASPLIPLEERLRRARKSDAESARHERERLKPTHYTQVRYDDTEAQEERFMEREFERVLGLRS